MGTVVKIQIHNFHVTTLYFQSTGSIDNIWELVSLLDGQTDNELSPEYNTGIMHYKHLTKFKAVSPMQNSELSLGYHLGYLVFYSFLAISPSLVPHRLG